MGQRHEQSREEAGRPDVFISYAREDQEFVRRLHDALERHGHGSWVDWEGIPPSAEWLDEIFAAIDGADTCLFVLSPDSVASEICRREVNHAIDSNKRLIPVICREVDADAVAKPLARLNWVLFSREADFDTSLALLIEALDTDLEWVHAHTRLLVRAREWDGRGGDRSLTLRGRDLRDAEEWLTRGPEKEPRPSALQTRFITASRGAATRRQRLTLVAVVTALVVSIGLGLLAESQRRLAEARRRVAVSQLLAAQARNRLDDQLDLSLLLSLEAHRMDDSFEARSSLLTALQQNPHIASFLHGHEAGVRDLAFDPTGERLASAGWDNRVLLWDLTADRPHADLLGRHDQSIEGIAIGPRGRVLASGSCGRFRKGLCEEGELRLWDLETRRPLGAPAPAHENWVNSVALSPDGRTLATASSDDTIRLWDLAAGGAQPPTPTRQLVGHDSWVVRVAFSPDGRRLASASWDRTVRLWDVRTGLQVGPPLRGSARQVALAFDPRGRGLAAAGADGAVRLWDSVDGAPLGEPLFSDRGGVNDLALGPDGRRLAAATTEGVVLLWDLAAKSQPPALLHGHPNEVMAIAFSPDGRRLASGDRDGLIILWDLAVSQPLAKTLEKGMEPVSRVTFIADGRSVVTLRGVSGDGFDDRLAVFDLEAGSPTLATVQGGILASAFSADGATLAVSDRSRNAEGESEVRLIDSRTGRDTVSPLVSRGGFVGHLAFSPDGSGLAAASESGVMLWELGGGPPRTLGDRGGALAFAPDGQLLAVADDEGAVVLWDVAAAAALGPLDGEPGRVAEIAFAPDGRSLVTRSVGKTSEENALRFWNVATRAATSAPIPDRWRTREMAFEPRGRILALATADGGVVLIDVATRRQFGPPLQGHPGGANAVAVDATGMWLASGGGDLSGGIRSDPSGEELRRSDGSLLLWDLDFESWRQRACRIANRNLSPEEWARYLGDEPPRDTCPRQPG